MLIKEYQTEWMQNFEDLKAVLQSALQGIEHRIEHVGSTSVPNLAAKPIIDIDIVYPTASDPKAFGFEAIKSRLLQIGYYHNGNQGIALREVFKRSGTMHRATLDTIRHHLYVCPQDSPALRRHLLFRDALRKDDAARLKYQAMKYELAEEAGQNQKVYAGLKEERVNGFIDDLIASFD